MYLIHFVKSGRGRLELNNQSIELKENDVFLIRPKELVYYVADEDEPWEYYYFAFGGAFAPELIERTIFKNGNFWYTMKDDSVSRIIAEAIEKIKLSKFADIFGLEQLFRLLPLFMFEKKNNNNSLQEQCVEAAKKYIHFNYSKQIRISDIAKQYNISRSYFFRLFKQSTGISVEEYIKNFRVQKAKNLLCETEILNSDIAQLVGYNSYSNFYNAFFSLVGYSPSEYRKRKRNSNVFDRQNGLLELNVENIEKIKV